VRHPDIISEIVGLVARPSMTGDQYSSGMRKWHCFMIRAKTTKTWFVKGAEDIAINSEYRAMYPWNEIEVSPNAGQLLPFQHFGTLLPRLAQGAHKKVPQAIGDLQNDDINTDP